MNPQRETLTIKEVAAELGVSVETIRTRVRDGELVARPKPIGAKRVFRLEFDRATIEAYKAAANSQ